MKKNVFERLCAGEPVNMFEPDYADAINEMNRTRMAIFDINQLRPDYKKVHEAFDRLFNEPMDETTNIATPCQIDFANQVKLGKNVFINHSLCMMSAGGIEIEDGVQIGPQATIVTTNHDFHNHNTLICGKVIIRRNVWIGCRVTIMPGVTIGENAVVAGGAVVTKDVPPNCVAGGVPAKVIKTIE
ncbi:DapH/DapD/GlmU-related protein [Prevotella sp. HUN102]|uniref:DapH/DapD/GlmU-related protein n=1 Tax=Prevotella sp. HUN102 TaxID=1392486 RepID=UPI00048C0E19|nr:DapH/DapD/GlmU-related protein [Prevotella sp. HUN102]